jgi:AcrR family transcriptional regulator
MPAAVKDHRSAIAERNSEAILDAAEALLERGASASTTAVANEAGVSRVTVYTHFPTREALVVGVAERVVERFRVALAQVDLREGDPLEVLEGLIALAWSEQGRYEWITRAISEELSPAALARSHRTLHRPIAALIKRGQKEGAFRRDLPADWLMSSYFALMHACVHSLDAGTVKAEDAVGLLQTTLRDLFTGCEPRRPRS